MNMMKKITSVLLLVALVIPNFCIFIHAAAMRESGEAEDGYARVYRNKKNDNMEIALTFDDGPHPIYTDRILDILDKYDVKATFFMIGVNVCNYTDAAMRVKNSGHEIGNHTNTHKRAGKLCKRELMREITDCSDILFNKLGYETKIIRPPEGSVIDPLLRCCGDLEYSVILWNIDTMDWAHHSAQNIYRDVMKNIDSGDIILMHDYIGKKSPTPEALELIIPALLEMGYKFVTVSELIGADD